MLLTYIKGNCILIMIRRPDVVSIVVLLSVGDDLPIPVDSPVHITRSMESPCGVGLHCPDLLLLHCRFYRKMVSSIVFSCVPVSVHLKYNVDQII